MMGLRACLASRLDLVLQNVALHHQLMVLERCNRRSRARTFDGSDRWLWLLLSRWWPRGSYIVNTARGKICDRDAIVRALESGQLAGYVGDVWFPQPPPRDHPWRTMPHHGMTPHVSGTSLSAQARYAAGTREILECWFEGRPIRDEYSSGPRKADLPAAGGV